MAELKQVGALELDEDLDFHHAEWRAAFATWILLILVMAATMLGVFGGGPLSTARAGDEGGPLRVEYARFARFGASTRLIVHVRAKADGLVRLSLNRELLEASRVTHITPHPASTRIVADGVEYRFETDPNATPVPIVFELQPARRWMVRSAVHTGGHTVRFRQFIYP